jgi:hypothetical protein
LGGFQSWFGRGGKKFLSLPEVEHRPSSFSLANELTELPCGKEYVLWSYWLCEISLSSSYWNEWRYSISGLEAPMSGSCCVPRVCFPLSVLAMCLSRQERACKSGLSLNCHSSRSVFSSIIPVVPDRPPIKLFVTPLAWLFIVSYYCCPLLHFSSRLFWCLIWRFYNGENRSPDFLDCCTMLHYDWLWFAVTNLRIP